MGRCDRVASASRALRQCRPDSERRVHWNRSSSSTPKRRLRRPNSPESAWALRHRGQLEILRTPRRRRTDRPCGLEPSGRPPQPRLSSGLPRERFRPSEMPEAPSTARKPSQGATQTGRQFATAQLNSDVLDAHFSRAGSPALTGITTPAPRHATRKGPDRNRSLQGNLQCS